MWRSTRPISLFALGVLILPLAASAQDAGEQPVLRVGTRTLSADGSRHRDAGIDRVMKAGDTNISYVYSGRVDDPDGSLCSMGATAVAGSELTDRDRQRMQGALYVWKVATTAVSYEAGRQIFDLDWQRFDSGATAPAISSKARLTLADGEVYTLDLVRASGAAPCGTRAAVVEVIAGIKEDPALADTVLRYDLWLVRYEATGRKESRHLVLGGVHGASTDFQFPALRTPVQKLQSDQYDFTVATRIAGTLRGRVTRHGGISLALETRRSDALERTSQAPSSLPPRWSGGRKVLTGAIGEAIEIQLPPGSGYMSSPASEKDAREIRDRAPGIRAGMSDPRVTTVPAQIRNGRLEVNYGPFFEGERLSIIVQVRRAEGVDAAVDGLSAASSRRF